MDKWKTVSAVAAGAAVACVSCQTASVGGRAGGPAVPAEPAAASFADFDRRALAGERLSVVFFGASLTWGANATDQAHTSYRARVAEMLEAHYPAAHFRYHDGAIGGTGSQLGVFRLDRDCLRWKPDLVFLDFSANDDIYSDNPESSASYEAIVRRLVDEAKVPVVQVLFPFKWNIKRSDLPGMKRRDIHYGISKAYNTGIGDAIELIIDRVEAGKTTVDRVWNTDGVHPGDEGYVMFAEAAWQGFEQAVAEKRVCRAPEKMLYADTYLHSNRFHPASLDPLPPGWRIGKPALTAVNYDWLMSRWLDDLAIAANTRKVKGADGKDTTEKVPAVAPLRLKVNASYVCVFGEASAASGRFRVKIDGEAVTGKNGQKKGEDTFEGNRWGGGYGHLAYELAHGLDTATNHLVEIEPVLADDKEQELRIESLCVAGGRATVEPAP
jgi:lysophospholipase L1-like esterase